MGKSGKDILYLGDSTLDTAASYLSLILEAEGYSYDYVPSDKPLSDDIIAVDYGLYILSDYPAAGLGDRGMDRIVRQIGAGAALLMIGGWESFQGQSGGYHGTAVSEFLPVNISSADDRINSAAPCCVLRSATHPIVAGLPFQNPPLVAGFNRFTAKDDATEVLSVARYTVNAPGDSLVFEEISRDPFLVTGRTGKGLTAALASDLAPHWVGGFVDWGDARVGLAGTGREVEVGNWYYRFAAQLLAWCLQR